jgi:nucleoid-associated protein YgaU
MPEQSKGISLLDQAINLVTNRDEKAALEAAKQHLLEVEQKSADAEKKAMGYAQRADIAERQVADLQASLAKTQADGQAALAKLQTEAQAAKSYIAQLEQRVATAEAKAKLYDDEKYHDQMQTASLAAEKARTLDMHTITANETLSDLSLKYYGHATEPYWWLIYEANKDAIGPNPNHVRPGTILKIPVLPAEMKK